MTAQERKAAIDRMIEAMKNTIKVVPEELQRAGDTMEPDATHGAALELLRGAPELGEELGNLVPGLVSTALLLAVELRFDVKDLRERVETLWSDESEMTDAILTLKLLPLLADCYAEEPQDITTTH